MSAYKFLIFHDVNAVVYWRRAWTATARLQGRRERERERKLFKLNAFLNYGEPDDRVTRQARVTDCTGCMLVSGTCLTSPLLHSRDPIAWQGRLEWQTALDVCWFQVRAWRHRSYIAEIPLLAHGLTVKLSPCQCSHSSPAGRIAAPLCEHPKSQSATGSLRLAPGWFSIFLVESVHSPHLLFFTDKPHACKLQSHNWLEVLWWVLYTQF